MSDPITLYGFEVANPPWAGARHWTVWALEALGMNAPWGNGSPSPEQLKDARRLIAEETGCVVETAGARNFLAAADSVGRPRGTIDPEWRNKLEELCEELSLPWSEPKWHGGA